MNVKEMISSMKDLGIGQVYTPEESERILLAYLNLAHEQLYRETADLNDDIIIDEIINSIPNQDEISLTNYPFSICEIYRVGYEPQVKGLSRSNFNKYKRNNAITGNPTFYNKKKKVIRFYPITAGVAYTFDISYAPQITRLQMITSESLIPYPVEFHGVLVDGGLYYLFQDESGFKNILKENEAKKRWDDGRSSLKSYLINSNKQQINTFQNA